MTQYQQGAGYDVDLVICIDGTSSMVPMFDTVKQNAAQIPTKYADAMARNQKTPRSLRARVIVFRDYKADGSLAMQESGEFFDLLDDDGQTAFVKYIDGIEPSGGGDFPENALEAIVLAMRSHWASSGSNRRQAILLFTDTEPLDLRLADRMNNPKYPEGMPANLDEMRRLYEYGDQEYATYYRPRYGRLVIYAPRTKESKWNTLRSWPRTWVVHVEPNGGCDSVDLDEALGMLCSTY